MRVGFGWILTARAYVGVPHLKRSGRRTSSRSRGSVIPGRWQMSLWDLRGVACTDGRTEDCEGGVAWHRRSRYARVALLALPFWDTRGRSCGHWPRHRHLARLEDAPGLEAEEAGHSSAWRSAPSSTMIVMHPSGCTGLAWSLY